MKRSLQNILITGGAGFIGSNFIRFLCNEAGFSGRIVNFDKLTYAGNPLNLHDISDDQCYTFVKGDICDAATVKQVFSKYEIDTVVHFAAESHVDRSIYGPMEFVHTNVIGTATLLEAARAAWQGRSDVLFHHLSVSR